MATVPPGPSSALPASPAESAPFPGAGAEDGGPRRPGEDSASGKPLAQDEKTVKKKPKNMLTRASPPALHLKMPAGEQQQQLNGLAASPAEEPGGAPADGCDSGDDDDGTPNCQREGPRSKNGRHSPLVNNSMNGMPARTRTQAATLASESSGDSEQPQPPSDELARLELGSLPGEETHDICYVRYESELQMPWIMRLITKDLSEPYSIYTYRYFIHNWPQLCFLAMVKQECVGAIVCKLDMHKKMFRRGYIAMLAVDSKHRRKSIGTNLVKKAIYAMVEGDCDEVVLETEITNKSALKLYENLGFVRDKRLFRYYLNGVDALRLKLWLR
ncbi:N-alpha-acetyltransferase 30 [Corythoichthys intestinalis]|uniref:N-alpha-acetyltransferase 30 n=1 Tax=Corythoichthys intestinalis TaxID=161448 RepID=UPI0025A627AC|nr:N-alpha-acetyltransferase 30 [Corythoichthys intestinalis]